MRLETRARPASERGRTREDTTPTALSIAAQGGRAKEQRDAASAFNFTHLSKVLSSQAAPPRAAREAPSHLLGCAGLRATRLASSWLARSQLHQAKGCLSLASSWALRGKRHQLSKRTGQPATARPGPGAQAGLAALLVLVILVIGLMAGSPPPTRNTDLR